MDPIKEAFTRIKEDISYLYNEIEEIKLLLNELKSQQSNQPTNQHQNTTLQSSIPTPLLQYSLKSEKTSISTRNEGVPTNQPTNQQTNQHPFISTPTHTVSSVNDRIDHIKKVSEILGTLDDLKKEVRLKFKKLTDQEMNIYSAIYQLEEQGLVVDYPLLAQKTNLSEISIRDYIRKILYKGIPLQKQKESNKRIIVGIPIELKRITSLNTLLQLRLL
jgi:hypothetical protein